MSPDSEVLAMRQGVGEGVGASGLHCTHLFLVRSLVHHAVQRIPGQEACTQAQQQNLKVHATTSSTPSPQPRLS